MTKQLAPYVRYCEDTLKQFEKIVGIWESKKIKDEKLQWETLQSSLQNLRTIFRESIFKAIALKSVPAIAKSSDFQKVTAQLKFIHSRKGLLSRLSCKTFAAQSKTERGEAVPMPPSVNFEIDPAISDKDVYSVSVNLHSNVSITQEEKSDLYSVYKNGVVASSGEKGINAFVWKLHVPFLKNILLNLHKLDSCVGIDQSALLRDSLENISAFDSKAFFTECVRLGSLPPEELSTLNLTRGFFFTHSFNVGTYHVSIISSWSGPTDTSNARNTFEVTVMSQEFHKALQLK
jgi:hypothetical protein